MDTKIKTAPAVEPVVAAGAKSHMNVDFSTDDTYITGLCTAARQYVEQVTNRAIITQDWYGYLQRFPSVPYIVLPYGTLQSVTAITYKNAAGTTETLANTEYIVDTVRNRVVLEYGKSWPTFEPYPSNAVTVDWKCGYGAAGTNVPGPILHAIKMLIADMYEARETVVTGVSVQRLDTVDRLLMPYRIIRF